MTDHIEDRSFDPFVTIDNRLLAMPLTVEAFRVYVQLKKYANRDRQCFPSYSRLGKECFRGSYPEGGESTLRKKAIASVKELIEWGVLLKEARGYGDTAASASNLYILTHPTQWRTEAASTSALSHPKRVKKASEGGSTLELPGSPVEPPPLGSPVELPGSPVELPGSNVEPITISNELISNELDPFIQESAIATSNVLPGISGFADESRAYRPPLTTLSNKPETLQPSDNPSCGQKSEAAAFDKIEQSNYTRHPIARMEEKLRSPELPPWMNSHGPNGWKPEFVESYRQYLSSTPRYAKELGRQATTGEAKNALARIAKTAEGVAEIQNHWESFQELSDRTQPLIQEREGIPAEIKPIRLSGRNKKLVI